MLVVFIIIMTAPSDEVDHDLIDDSFMSLLAGAKSFLAGERWLLAMHNSTATATKQATRISDEVSGLLTVYTVKWYIGETPD